VLLNYNNLTIICPHLYLLNLKGDDKIDLLIALPCFLSPLGLLAYLRYPSEAKQAAPLLLPQRSKASSPLKYLSDILKRVAASSEAALVASQEHRR
jgi:hypothetical protein